MGTANACRLHMTSATQKGECLTGQLTSLRRYLCRTSPVRLTTHRPGSLGPPRAAGTSWTGSGGPGVTGVMHSEEDGRGGDGEGGVGG